jgi:hypothetical protein
LGFRQRIGPGVSYAYGFGGAVMAGISEQIGMGSGAVKGNITPVRFIYKEPISLDMTFPRSLIYAMKRVVAVFFRKGGLP